MKASRTFDQEKVSLNLARLKKEGENYEIVIDPDLAVSYKEGEDADIEDVLKAQAIFSDAKKGEHASEERMHAVFKTNNPLEIAKHILEHGQIQLTAQYRAKVREDKRKALVQLICKNACDPKTKLPHPPARIENALNEAKVKIDEFKRVQDQLQDAIKALRPILPISIETRIVKITLPSQFAAKLYGMLQNYGKTQSENWLSDGSWEGTMEIAAGQTSEFFEKLNQATHSDVKTEIIR